MICRLLENHNADFILLKKVGISIYFLYLCMEKASAQNIYQLQTKTNYYVQ